MSTEATLRDLRFIATRKDPTSPDPTKARFGEASKFLPVAFVFFFIITLWCVYTFCHCIPMMADKKTYATGWWWLVVFNVVTILVITCYFKSMLQHPGTIPDNTAAEEGELTWEYAPQDGRAATKDAAPLDPTLQEQKERKRLGDRRNCKWCNKYKPDRCHHCRVCRMCILKMDHHCPWIYNCVGFKNFKYFFLLVLYAAIDSNIITWTMWGTVRQVTNDAGAPFLWMFFVLFGESLAALMAFLLTSFLAFHIHLMLRAMTTIEFCEKSRRPNFDTDVYSRGLLGNIKAVLGDNPLFWFVPICPPSGNGMTFTTDTDASPMLLAKDTDRDDRRKLHETSYGTTQPGRSKQKNGAGTGEAPDYGESSLEPERAPQDGY